MALMGVSTTAHPKLPIPSIDEEEAVLEFLAEAMDITFERRETNFVDIPAELVHSGDFIGNQHMDGLGAMIQYGTGAVFGHTLCALWFEDGLYIVESTGPVVKRNKYE